jgi:hypothetical protein
MHQVRFALETAGIALSLFLGMVLFLEAGRRLGERKIVRHGKDARSGVGVVDGAVYGLLGLLIGFMFSGASTRFDQRRQLIAQEVIVISTAWLRLDALPRDSQLALRTDFRRYVDALLDAYLRPRSPAASLRESTELERARIDVWSKAVAACLSPGGEPARMLVLPALNEMFAAVAQERLIRRVHPPWVTFALLCLTALASALFGGYGMAGASTRNWIYVVGVAATVALAIYVIIDLEFPRRGLIRVDTMDAALVELRATME